MIEIPGALFGNCMKTPDVNVYGIKVTLGDQTHLKIEEVILDDFFFPKGKRTKLWDAFQNNIKIGILKF